MQFRTHKAQQIAKLYEDWKMRSDYFIVIISIIYTKYLLEAYTFQKVEDICTLDYSLCSETIVSANSIYVQHCVQFLLSSDLLLGVYVCSVRLVASIYISEFVSNVVIIITAVVSRDSANKISKISMRCE